MESIWGKGERFNYSKRALDLFDNLFEANRAICKREFLGGFIVDRDKELYAGGRTTREQCLWVLQSKVTEEQFLQEPERYIQRVVLGAMQADYYYRYEKKWD